MWFYELDQIEDLDIKKFFFRFFIKFIITETNHKTKTHAFDFLYNFVQM